MSEYQVQYYGRQVGTAEITQQGLYHQIACKLSLPYDAIYRVYVSGSGKQLELGVCVPDGEYFVLNKRVPGKRLIGFGKLSVFVDDDKVSAAKNRIPVSNSEPFEQLHKLRNGRFQWDGGAGFIILESVE